VIPRTNYLLFIDECGTHDMAFVDPKFPVFVLLGLLVGETYYAKTLVRRTKELKHRHLGTDEALLHSKEIRRAEGVFAFLRQSEERRDAFYADVNALFLGARIRLFAVVIDKEGLRRRFLTPLNPYHVSLSQLLSIVLGPPRLPGPNRPKVVRIIAESRGRKEDNQLQREFQTLRASGFSSYGATDVQNRKTTTVQRLYPERIDFVKKAKVVTGLELADLAAYPIARATINRNWENPAAQIVAKKLHELIQFP
jgi:hypothetical protein